MANLLTGNSADFGTGLGVWLEYANASRFALTHSAEEGGVARVEVTNGGVNMTIGTSRNTDALTSKIPVTAGQTITIACRSRFLVGTARNLQMGVDFYDSGNVGIDFVVPSEFPVAMTPEWTTRSANITVPANSVRAQLTIQFRGAVTGDVYLVDDVLVDDNLGGGGNTGGGSAGGDTLSYRLTGSGTTLLREDRIT